MPNPVSSHLTLRPAVIEDCRRLWEWRNEHATREASFNTEYIPFEEHESWFTRKLTDPHMRILIATDSHGCDIGYVRFDISGGEAEISISIDQNERGKGYGIAVIKSGSEHLMTTVPVKRIVAHMKTENVASAVVFERAGFVLKGYKQIAGVKACEMVYEPKPAEQ